MTQNNDDEFRTENTELDNSFRQKSPVQLEKTADTTITDEQPQTEALVDNLLTWLKEIPAQKPVKWEQLPDIGLYMDQVVTYVDRQLSLHSKTAEKYNVTSAMINNYIKAGLLPRANQKKYNLNHLALLTIIGALKPVLSIQELQIMLENNKTEAEVATLYSRFLQEQQAAVNETNEIVSARINQLTKTCAESGTSLQFELQQLAMDLAIDARVRILVAGQILAAVEEVNNIVKTEKPSTHEKNRRK